ncbi:MAG: oligosaccharide flippase family protein, partial [Bacillota bacterium]
MSSETEPHLLGSFRSIAAGSFWTAMGYGARHVLAAAASVLVARLLGAEVFGEYGMIASTVAFLGTAADLGMSVSATRFVAAYRISDPERARRSLSMSIQATLAVSVVVGVLLAITAPYLAAVWLHNARLTGPMRVATLAILFSATGSAVSGGLRGLGLFRPMAVVEMVLGVVTASLMVAGAWFGRLEGATIGLVVGSGLRMAAYAVPLAKHTRPLGWTLWSADAWREAGAILRFSIPAFASGFLVTPILWGVRVLLANSPRGYGEVGTFSAALQWQTPLTFLSVVVATVLLPSMSEQYAQGDRKRLVETFRVGFSLLGVVQLVSTALLVILSGPIASLYGQGYRDLRASLTLVVVATFFNAVLSIPGQVLAATNRMWLGFALNLVWASVFLIGSKLAVAHFGAVGASAAYLLSYLVHALTSTLG